jgi:hypothetical protein
MVLTNIGNICQVCFKYHQHNDISTYKVIKDNKLLYPISNNGLILCNDCRDNLAFTNHIQFNKEYIALLKPFHYIGFGREKILLE